MYGFFPICLYLLHISAAEENNEETTAKAYLSPADAWNPAKTEFKFESTLGFVFRRSMNDGCHACFADDRCFDFNTARCLYYAETSKVLKEDSPKVEHPSSQLQLKAEADSLIFSVMDKARESHFEECIPYVSRYTDCTKENICTGCKTCECSSAGTWSCNVTQTCRPDMMRPVADRRTLIMVMENLQKEVTEARRKRSIEEFDDNRSDHAKLETWITGEPTLNVKNINENDIYQQTYQNIEPTRTLVRHKNDTKLLKFIVNSLINDALPGIFKETYEYETNRVKRWILNKTKPDKTPSKITFAELTDWLNDVHPFIYVSKSNKTKNIRRLEDIQVRSNKETTKSTTSTTSNPDYLAFDEVYYNIAVNHTNNRKKPLLNEHQDNHTADLDFNMYDDKFFEEETGTTSTLQNDLIATVQGTTDTIITTTATPEHLEAVTQKVTEYVMDEVTEVVVDLLESAKKHDLEEGNETEMDINSIIDDPRLDKLDDININDVTIMKRDVHEDIDLNPLTLNHSTTLPSEPNSLVGFKDTIMDPLNNILKHKHIEIAELLKIKANLIAFSDAVKASFQNKSNNDFVSVYKVEVVPRSHHEHHESHYLTTKNSTLLDKYLIKLKHDVLEVIKDIIAVKKMYKHDSDIPESMKFLIKYMKHYIHKQGFRINKSNKNYRRTNYPGNAMKTAIVKVIDLLVKSRVKTNSLESLSPSTRKILKRIIKSNYINEFASTGLRVYDPHYNLTNDLKNIASRWPNLLTRIENSSIFDALYNMKLFHLQLSVDIAKMTDALALIDFARSRRMAPVDEVIGEAIMSRIDKSLKASNNRIYNILAAHGSKTFNLYNKPTYNLGAKPKNPKKQSFLGQIRTLLSNSKKDILRLLHKKVPKVDIVRQIAKKNAEEMARKKLEETMEKWQNNLNMNVGTKKKRSAIDYDALRVRMKNIIPKYLRGKVHPAIAKKGKNKKKDIKGYKKKLKAKSKSTKTTPKPTKTLSTIKNAASTRTKTTTTKLPNNKVTNTTTATDTAKTKTVL